ncbi:polysaccharide deacetylase family protein [Bacillus sp. CGMCC 1.16541]|uniref:polysaccharide deacetylase family protein n=1 Tax=Bacillus sp. CGMCC 1.16541 TaxID=2185143 RepID=UPI0013A58490|nr:polysaccharide deacetylase family protein [Bacillus sp. CGMCC 1.16541]
MVKQVVLIVIAWIILFVGTGIDVTAKTTTFLVKQDVVIFKSEKGVLKSVGLLNKGQSFQAVGETKSHYAIQLGEEVGYVAKSASTPTTMNIHSNVTTQTALTTTTTVHIYINKEGTLIQIGALHPGIRYSIISDYGVNWYKIHFGGQEAFVPKKGVTTKASSTLESVKETTPINQKGSEVSPPIEKKPVHERVVTTKRATVYVNRAGALVEVGILEKGTRYKVRQDYGPNWYEVEYDNQKAFLCKCAVNPDKGIPVLMYHHILTAEEKAESIYANASTTVTDQEFYTQMDYLKENGFKSITAQELFDIVTGEKEPPSKAVLITFDDGLNSVLEYGYPKLKEHQFKAIQFIISGRIPASSQPFHPFSLRFLSMQEMNQMSDVFDYGGHTHQLHNLVNNQSEFVSKSHALVMEDLRKNRQEITDTTFFAYPFGQYTTEQIKQIKEAGFTMAFTTKNGRVHPHDDIYQLKRQNVNPGITLEQFAQMVEN